MIRFSQKAWLKPYIDMNTELRKDKNNFEKHFQVDEQCSFWKNQGELRDIKLATAEANRNYLVSGPNSQTTKKISKILLATEMKKNVYE